MKDVTSGKKIIRFQAGHMEELVDTLIRESWINLYANNKLLLHAPVLDKEIDALIHGLLFIGGPVSDPQKLTVEKKGHNYYVHVPDAPPYSTPRELVEMAESNMRGDKTTLDSEARAKEQSSEASAKEQSSEGRPNGSKKLSAALEIEFLLQLVEKFQQLPSLYHHTGGVHMAAFASGVSEEGPQAAAQTATETAAQTAKHVGEKEGGPDILFFADDISRRNAVDKVIGKAFLAGKLSGRGETEYTGAAEKTSAVYHPAVKKMCDILLLSGRISSDIVVRAIGGSVPLVVSKSAPTDKAVEMANYYGITLCGFARGRRINIYTHGERLSHAGEPISRIQRYEEDESPH